MLDKYLERREWYTDAFKDVLRRKRFLLTATGFFQKAMDSVRA